MGRGSRHREAGAATVRLRDGSTAAVRPIRPDDKDALLAGFERLSPDSRYRRFLTPMRTLTATQLAYLTEVDHRDHEALMAFDRSGDAVGVARYVREAGTDRAEAAVTVADDWQGKGLGTALTEMLAGRALEEGVRTFTALLLRTNREMVDVFESLGEVRVTRREGDVVEIEVPLEQGSRELRGILRALAARGLAPAGAGSEPPGFDLLRRGDR